ncbi:MAG TPA: peptidoglycan-binding domain-containing protein [Rubricoccaceae bacterium]|jgi:hypothetical protein
MTIDMLAGLAAGAAATTAAKEPGPIHAALPVVDAVRRDLLTYDAQRARTEAGVRLCQELLSVYGPNAAPFATDVDGDHGEDTTRKLRAFQLAQRLPQTGQFDEPTFRALVAPILASFALPVGKDARSAVVAAANLHAAYSAREIKPNAGPWVRTYMAGNEGAAWAWCAGFASFVWLQAAAAQADATAVAKARRYRTFGCDEIATRAKADGRFVEGADVVAGRAAVLPGDLFLVQARERDWVHVGVVTAVRDGGRRIGTVEGNTNSGGSREGLYVLARERSVAGGRASGLDFVRCPFAAARAPSQPAAACS